MRIWHMPLALRLHLDPCCLQKIGIIQIPSSSKKWVGCAVVSVTYVLDCDVQFQSALHVAHTLTFVFQPDSLGWT